MLMKGALTNNDPKLLLQSCREYKEDNTFDLLKSLMKSALGILQDVSFGSKLEARFFMIIIK